MFFIITGDNYNNGWYNRKHIGEFVYLEMIEMKKPNIILITTD